MLRNKLIHLLSFSWWFWNLLELSWIWTCIRAVFQKPGTCRFAVRHFCTYILNGNLHKFKPYESQLNSQSWDSSPLPLQCPVSQQNSIWEAPTLYQKIHVSLCCPNNYRIIQNQAGKNLRGYVVQHPPQGRVSHNQTTVCQNGTSCS